MAKTEEIEDGTFSLAGLSAAETATIIPGGLVFLGYRGSIAHGMYVPNSDPNSIDDKDIMGVCVPPLDVYFGLSGFEQQECALKEWDSVVYEARKFVRLLVKGNPNVLSLLWLPERHTIYKTPEWDMIQDARDIFIGRHVYHSFTGYAYGQLKRMTHLAFKGYMGDKRKRLVEKFGYDTKNAAHLIRLLRMSIEFLREGTLHVDRGEVGDATQLIGIKKGEWALERVQKEADVLFKRAEQAYDECKLPAGPNHDEANDLVKRVVASRLKVEALE